MKTTRAKILDRKISQHHSYVPGCPGIEQLHFTWTQIGMPIAYVWYRQDMIRHLNISYMWVWDYARRQGLAGGLLRSLRKAYPEHTICTAQGNKFSTGLLKKFGFVQDPSGWYWFPPAKKVTAK